MKALVFGGSFDPPHAGHAALLSRAAEEIRPDRILVVPAYRAPLKGAPQSSPADRLRMIREGLLRQVPPPWRSLCRIDEGEMRSRRRVYTVETLKRLKRLGELHFAVGSDAAAAFPSWKSPKELLALATWWTAARPGSAGEIPAHFKRLAGEMPAVSSTDLRRALEMGQEDPAWLSPAVLSYIRKKGLYGTGLLAELKESLKAERYEHTLAVASLAARLARRWRADEQKARLAGLLHDCGRAVAVPDMPRQAKKRKLKVPDLEGIARHNPLLAHAYLSEDLARRSYGVTDPEVLSAIRKHTLGDLRMSLLDRLLYVADACSEDRGHAAATRNRELAFDDLAAAFKACVQNKISHALSKEAWLHPLTVSLWNGLLKT